MKPRSTLEAMAQAALPYGGRCLARIYVNDRTKLLWECAEGHRWEATPNNVKRGKWCPTCRGSTPHGIAAMRKLAVTRKGVCLSTIYRSARSTLRWCCEHGHEWEASPTNVLRGSWCPHCAGCARLPLKRVQAAAQALGGACLSTAYRNNRERLTWECSRGHVWQARADHVLAGHWCPYCQDLTGEDSCRTWLESHFGQPFPKAWPSWLRSKAGRKLQLDGYNEGLRLAFEYQGTQHYRFVPWFHKTPQEFEAQKQRDVEKASLCEARGVFLLVVPFNKRPVGGFMKKQLRAGGFGG